MKLMPSYTVSYKGVFHPAGVAFEIDEKDEREMSAHGEILNSPVEPTVPRKGGRPRKAVSE